MDADIFSKSSLREAMIDSVDKHAQSWKMESLGTKFQILSDLLIKVDEAVSETENQRLNIREKRVNFSRQIYDFRLLQLNIEDAKTKAEDLDENSKIDQTHTSIDRALSYLDQFEDISPIFLLAKNELKSAKDELEIDNEVIITLEPTTRNDITRHLDEVIYYLKLDARYGRGDYKEHLEDLDNFLRNVTRKI